MSVTAIDANPAHLYPEFRAKLEAVLAEAPHGPWRIAEGYRSQARQTWLFASGRTRPGSIITWMRRPLNHGAGLAADVVPAAGYDAPRSTWEGMRAVYLRHGLENPAWSKGDLGHIQWPSSDQQTHQEAEDWVEAGFPAVAPADEVPLVLEGKVLPFAGEIRNGTTYAPLRPLTEALDIAILEVTAKAALLNHTSNSGAAQESVPLTIIAGRGWSPVRQVAAVAGLSVNLVNGRVELA